MQICYLFLFLTFPLLSREYKFDGYFKEPDGKWRTCRITYFLPCFPKILIWNTDREVEKSCAYWRPHADFIAPSAVFDKNFKCDLLWLDAAGSELKILQNYSALNKAQTIYVSTFLNGGEASFEKLNEHLEMNGFRLFSHWYWEGESGHALYLKKQMCESALQSISFTPAESNQAVLSSKPNLESFLRKQLNKSGNHKIDEIDFIYMINLDERPEKFYQAAKTLYHLGIHPYRFSGINGWKLPTSVLNQIGLKFVAPMRPNKLMGTIFKETDGKEFVGNEFIDKFGETYFFLGLTRGAIGVIMSHLSILNDALESGYKTIWVMEDDVEALEDPLQFSSLIRELDQICDWDILYTDTDTKDFQGNHVQCRDVSARPNFNMPTKETLFSRFKYVNANFSRVGMRFGTYSMIIRRSGIEKILNYYKTYGIFLPYDMDYWLIHDLNMYCTNRDIVSHKAGSISDNSNPP